MKEFMKVASIISAGLLIIGSYAIAGCGQKAEVKPVSGEKVSQTESDEGYSEIKEESVAVLPLGEKGQNKKFETVAEKVTATDNLSSPEATALLQKGEPGESPESTGVPAEGNEYLLVTLKVRNIDSKPHVVAPLELKLENKEAEEYARVVTNGRGGLYNMNPIEPGKDGLVTAVYEVPKDEVDLVLTYQPFDDEALGFDVR
ncbi:MAG: DUF4352 domain-containing protein [Actinobacteria bacterium]|nr:DUF4352 domain-containing protein [Actinomycetota bacterium]